MPVDLNELDTWIEEHEDDFKDLDLDKIKDIFKNFADDHKQELTKLGKRAISVVFKILKGKLTDAEIEYREAVEGKNVAELLEEARSNFRDAREQQSGFMNFVLSVGKISGAIITAAIRQVGIPV